MDLVVYFFGGLASSSTLTKGHSRQQIIASCAGQQFVLFLEAESNITFDLINFLLYVQLKNC